MPPLLAAKAEYGLGMLQKRASQRLSSFAPEGAEFHEFRHIEMHVKRLVLGQSFCRQSKESLSGS